jgi:ribonuclease PH
VEIHTGYLKHPPGSCLISCGGTRVICTATVASGTPPFAAGRGGWVTAEYAMLPGATDVRTEREANRGGRAREIQRLIGRSLRAATDLGALGDRTVTVDCDVIQADGGTRTASITGGYVALALAFRALVDRGLLDRAPLRAPVAAVSVGIVKGRALLDLCYEEDRDALVDMNVVATADGRLVEVQGTAEQSPFAVRDLDRMLELALGGIRRLARAQAAALGRTTRGRRGR